MVSCVGEIPARDIVVGVGSVTWKFERTPLTASVAVVIPGLCRCSCGVKEILLRSDDVSAQTDSNSLCYL